MSKLIRLVRVLGGAGLAWLGMPPPQTIGEYPSNRDLHAAHWEKYGLDHHGDPYTKAALQAELYVLEAFGLISTIVFDPIPVYDRVSLLKVTFCYTEKGAAAALAAWHNSKSNMLPPFEWL